jgi:PAS domain S-box-containing protein
MLEPIRVLHVDDSPAFLDVSADVLEQEHEQISLRTATSARDALDQHIDGGETVDCIVSEYDLPEMDGLAFLERVRERDPDLPFMLFTGKGSEEVASQALSAGATDYIRKQSEQDQYTVLANRIENAVSQYRSDRKRQLEYQRSVLDAVVETVPQGILVVDETRDFFTYNERFVEMWDIPDEVVETGDDQRAVESVLDRLERPEQFREQVEYFYDHPDETSRDTIYLSDGRIFERYTAPATADDGTNHGRVWIFRDITERTEREERLTRKQRQFEATFNTPNTFIGILEPDGTIRNINQTALEFIETGLAAVEGEPFWNTLWWDHSTDLQEQLREYIQQAADGEYARFEADHYAPDGTEVTVDVVIRPVRDEERDVVSLIVEGRDITERVEAKDELRRQNERLDDFASVVSHDLRNPLNVAKVRLELATDDCDSPHLEDIEQAHDRMETLISDLLTLAREGEQLNERREIDLDSLTRQCWQTVDTADATLVVDGDLSVCADENRLSQLLENLVRNAVEHAGESVTVTVGPLESASGFYVADDGPGIPPDEREQIFETGYSTAGGNGLGLRIAETVATAHDWEIRVTDSEDGGARFEVTGVDVESE